MIVTIRGANGSGKSTVVRQFVELIGGFDQLESIHQSGRSQPLYYISKNYQFALIGHYKAQCGGADTVPFSDVRPLVIDLHGQKLSVVYESMLFSVESKQLFLIKDQIPDVRIIHLTTPADQCIKNIYKRREISGKRLGTSLDEERVKVNYAKIEHVRETMIKCGVYYRRASVSQAARLMKRWLCRDKR